MIFLQNLEILSLILIAFLLLSCIYLLSKGEWLYLSKQNFIFLFLIVFIQIVSFLSIWYLNDYYDEYYYFPFFYFYAILFNKIINRSLKYDENITNIFFILSSLLVGVYLVIFYFGLEDYLFSYYISYNVIILGVIFLSLYNFTRLFKKSPKITLPAKTYFRIFIIYILLHFTFIVYSFVNDNLFETIIISNIAYLFIYLVLLGATLVCFVDNYLDSFRNNNVTTLDSISNDETILKQKVAGNDLVVLKTSKGNIDKEKYKNSKISDNELSLIKEKLIIIETKKLYLNPELDLEILSKELKISKYNLSQSFGILFGTNFKDYVNKLRCEFASNLLLSDNYDTSVLEIGFKSGFNSKTSYYRTFNKIYNCSPAAFRKSIIENN